MSTALSIKFNARILKVGLITAFILILNGCFANLAPKNTAIDEPDLIETKPFDELCTPPEFLPEFLVYDLWQRMREDFQWESIDNSRVDIHMRWYLKHPRYIERVTQRGSLYLFHILNELELRDMPYELALLPIVESAFDPFAYSPSRASGLWQFVPWTARDLKLKQSWWYDGRRDVVASTSAALTYLQRLHKRYDGDWLLALAAYNSGMGRVNRAIRKNKKAGLPTDFWNLNLPKETASYVPRMIALAKIFENPSKYKLTLSPAPNTPQFAKVFVDSQIDLAQAADFAEIDMNTLYGLNPGFNRWATDPDGPHTLLIPIAKESIFRKNLAANPAESRMTWTRYRIKRGDSLSTIARKFKLSAATLKSVNKIKGTNIREGKTLLIPKAGYNSEHYSKSFEQRLAKRQAQGKKSNLAKSVYTINSGDSLWSISRKFGVTDKQIARWNNMAPKDLIHIGQKLTIWTKRKKVASQNGNEGVLRKLSYRVRKGDSLARIAGKFKVRIHDIVKWNALNQKHYLQPGQSLTLYVDVKNS
ncbi:MAG: membrane-bound lytic murein transglycosylase D [Flavobacteriales bacterium]|jgi:membrane-bound lytic murein transglycosylase D